MLYANSDIILKKREKIPLGLIVGKLHPILHDIEDCNGCLESQDNFAVYGKSSAMKGCTAPMLTRNHSESLHP